METLSVTVRYRPVRVGFCVRQGDFAAIRNVWRTCNSLWGGRYNPILVVDAPDLARTLIEVFRVDILWPVTDDGVTKEFIDSFKHLPSPFTIRPPLFPPSGDEDPRLLDILHPLHAIYEEHFKNNISPAFSAAIYAWDENDPLQDVFHIAPGAVVDPKAGGADYLQSIEETLHATRLHIKPTDPFPAGPGNQFLVSAIGRYNVKRHHLVSNRWSFPGFFYGSASDFDDLVTYWNLRATDTHVFFYDPAHEARFRPVREMWSEQILRTPAGRHREAPRVAVWSRTQDEKRDLSAFGKNLTLPTIEARTWGGMNLTAPYMYFNEGSTLAAVEETGDGTHISFQLPPKPFADAQDYWLQHMVVAVDPGIRFFSNERVTLETPFVPALNVFYGRKVNFDWSTSRVEPSGLGVISHASQNDMTFRALDVRELIYELAKSAGITAEASNPGLIAKRLIEQMGGLDRCRVFKVKGVRDLIEAYGPQKSFTQSAAIQKIRDQDPPGTGTIGFAQFEGLYIEPRSEPALTPNMCFSFLMKKRIFHAGLEFTCPTCQLPFWISIDQLRTDTTCEYCGSQFNVTPYLRDRDWRYRRSGLLGRDDNQEGAIPVLLTLQQICSRFSFDSAIYTTATKFKSGSVQINECESDFVVIHPRAGPDKKVQIVIGECKTRQPIEAKDVQNLLQVANALSSAGFDVFVVLAKLTPFSTKEIGVAKALNREYERRAILLTARELEPYFVFERTAKEFDIEKHGAALEDMARVTHEIYFSGTPPKKPATAGGESGSQTPKTG